MEKWTAPAIASLRGDNTIPLQRTFASLTEYLSSLSDALLIGNLPTGGTTGQILSKIDATDYNTQWIDNFAEKTKCLVKSDNAATLPKGAAVYTSGANGTNILVKGAIATSDATSASVIGLLETSLAYNAQGYVITEGLVSGIDTSAAVAGDPVWLSPTTSGGLVFGLANKPNAPYHLVYLGVVTRAHAINGEINVHMLNGWELEELHNVSALSPTTGDTIIYNATTSLWEKGKYPAAQLSGTALPATIVTSSLTSVGTLSSGSVPASLLTGTISSARLPSVNIGTTSVDLTRASGALTLAGITLTSPSLSSPTATGTGTFSLGSLSSTSGTTLTPWTTSATTTNSDYVDLRLIRRATGSDWTTAYYRLGRLVDATRMGFVQFGSSSSGNQTVELGISSTSYLSVNGTTAIINMDLPITSTYSFSATNSGNQTNYVKLGTGATDSNATLFGYTAYGNLRTTCGYNVGISWISTGGASPSGFVPNAHAVFLAGTTVSGDIRSNANNSTSYNTTSDYRLKKDVVDINDGMSLIRKLKPKRFKFINDPSEKVFDGFLAHEVQDIVPIAVSGVKDAVGENGHPIYQQIDTSWMVALLAAGIKELDQRLTELEKV